MIFYDIKEVMRLTKQPTDLNHCPLSSWKASMLLIGQGRQCAAVPSSGKSWLKERHHEVVKGMGWCLKEPTSIINRRTLIYIYIYSCDIIFGGMYWEKGTYWVASICILPRSRNSFSFVSMFRQSFATVTSLIERHEVLYNYQPTWCPLQQKKIHSMDVDA